MTYEYLVSDNLLKIDLIVGILDEGFKWRMESWLQSILQYLSQDEQNLRNKLLPEAR